MTRSIPPPFPLPLALLLLAPLGEAQETPPAVGARWSTEGLQPREAGGSLHALTTAWSVTGAAGDALGTAIAVVGDVDGDGHVDFALRANGSPPEVRVHRGDGSSLEPVPAWTFTNPNASSQFGTAIAPAGDVNGDGYGDFLVGDPGSTSGQGLVELYTGSPTGPARTFADAGSEFGAELGTSVSTAGDVDGDGYSDFVVGEPGWDLSFLEPDAGRATLWFGSSSGPTSPVVYEGPNGSGRLGSVVSAAGDVNGDGFDDFVIQLFDAAFLSPRLTVYWGSASGPVAAQALLGADAASDVAPAGDVNGDGYGDLLVGKASSGSQDEGLAEVYPGGPSGLGSSPWWAYAGSSPNAFLGEFVAPAGDVDGDGFADVLVGGSGDEDPDDPKVAEGGVHLFLGHPSMSTSPYYSLYGGQTAARLSRVAPAGDVDGDGHVDFVAAAPQWDEGASSNAGRVTLHLGEPIVPRITGLAKLNLFGPAGSETFGVPFGLDVDGDGYQDLLVSDEEYQNPHPSEGALHVYRGVAFDDWSSFGPSTTIPGGHPNALLSGAPVGDVDGDGFEDVVAFTDNVDGSSQNALLLFAGSADGLEETASWTLDLGHESVSFTPAGDVDGDGFADLLVGRFEAPPERAEIYFGSRGGLETEPGWQVLGPTLGWAVSSLGDVNGDGYDDVFVGRQPALCSEPPEQMLVFHGAPDGPSQQPDWTYDAAVVTAAGDVNGDGYGDAVATRLENECVLGFEVFHGSPGGLDATPASLHQSLPNGDLLYRPDVSPGDVDGDGYGDLLVSDPTADPGGGFNNEGQALLWLGSAAGLEPQPEWHVVSPYSVFTNFGVGDFLDPDGDGWPEIAIGVPLANEIALLGGNDGGWLDALRMLHPTEGRTIAEGGRTGFAHELRIVAGVRDRPPAGLGWLSPEPKSARLQWELEPAGLPFDGVGFEMGTQVVPLTGGAPGPPVSLDELVEDLPADEALHWRVRLVFEGTVLLQHSPWFTLPSDAPTANHVKTPVLEGSPGRRPPGGQPGGG